MVPLYSSFFDEDIAPYGGKPMKIVIGDISHRVDRTYGTREGNAQCRLSKKYELIFKISKLLPVELQNNRQ